MKKLYFIIILFTLGTIACMPSKKKQIENISRLEKSVGYIGPGESGNKKAVELITAYQKYASDYPSDTLSPAYLFKMAELQVHAVSPQEAINTLDRIRKDFPDYRKVPECLFLTGFFYENNLNDLDKAKRIYREFLEKYPDHYFAKDARVLIQNLGKSPEELVKEFEARNDSGEADAKKEQKNK